MLDAAAEVAQSTGDQFTDAGEARQGGSSPRRSQERYLDDGFAVLQRPSGADWLFLAAFPALKRRANKHCASGATEIETCLGLNLVS
jgi:hypothetical protein